MNKILIYTLFLLGFSLVSCAQDNELTYWKELGKVNLSGKNLIITVPKKGDFNEKYVRFYLASSERTSENNNLDAYKISFYNGDVLIVDKENTPGGFEEEVFSSAQINQDENYYYLEIPNKFLFENKMRLWSAYEKEVFVEKIKLYSKNTGKRDKSDPYPFILIIK
ncbi:MAG: hypothetical protein IH619_01735 [Ignavibacterium sp.]|nr:hypothetical protein [Ignavibacterium sp.]